MDLTTQHKLMMLFLSPSNQLLRRVRILGGWKTSTFGEDEVQDLTGVSRETPKNWRKGKEMRKSKVDSVFSTTLAALDASAEWARQNRKPDEDEYLALRATIQQYAAAFEDEKTKLYDAAWLLGMSATQCQQTLDSIIYDSWPLLPAVYYEQAPKSTREPDIAQQHIDVYEGIYLAWVRRYDLWLQCPLRVRYLQSGGAGRFIRCKLNFPVIPQANGGASHGHADRPDYWEYDGFLAVRDNKLFWTFEKRQHDRNDYFHFITNAESTSGESHLTLSGRYLTTGQDSVQSIVTGSILLHRMFRDDGTDPRHLHYREIMWTHAKVLTSPGEIQQAEQRWKQYCGRASDDVESS